MSDLIPKLRFNTSDTSINFDELSNLCEKIGDGLHSTPKYSDNDEFYFVNGNNLKNNQIIIDDKTKTVDINEYNKHKKNLNHNSVLISINGTIGNLALYNNEKVILGKSACYINVNPIKLNKSFLLYQLNTIRVKKYFEGALTGSTIKNLGLKSINKTKIYLPTIDEQTKIAEFLTSVDKQIELLETKKSKLNTYKSGLMQKLFSQELRFKDDNGNDYPEWETKTIKQLGKIYGGGTPSTSNEQYWNGSIPWISSSDIDNNDIHNIKVSRYINEQALKDSATKIIEKNNLLIISRVGVGKFVTNSIDVCTSQDFSNLVIDKQIISNKFLAYYLLHNKNILFRISQGTTIKGFTNDDLYKVKINTPLLDEQTKIAEFLTSIDQQIDAVDQQIKKTQSFKKGLLQQMFV